MDRETRQAVEEYLLALGDDELILGHRASEWCGHAPILEEDIAFANLALDEIGHAQLWYHRLAELHEADPESYPDRLVYFRPMSDYRCCPLVELPNVDWAFSMLRQYLFDAAEIARLTGLKHSAYPPLAEVAAKVLPEESYHLRHTRAWVKRLALGTSESNQRMQGALESLWPYTAGLFAHTSQDSLLAQAGVIPNLMETRQQWEDEVMPLLESGGLELPVESQPFPADRQVHTRHMAVLLADLQSVARLDPAARW